MSSEKRNIYRKAALERLSSPEQLDKMITIVPLGLWIAALGGAVIVGITLIWSIVGRIPVTVQTSGIYMYGDGVHTIYAGNGGIVDAVYVKDGDIVYKDQLIAVYQNDEVQRKIEDLNERRTSVENVTFYSTDDPATDDNKSMRDIKSQLLTVDSYYLADTTMLETKRKDLAKQRERMNAAYSNMLSARSRYYSQMNDGSASSEQIAMQDAQNAVQEARGDWQQAMSDYEYSKSDIDRAKNDVATAKNDYERAKNDALIAKKEYDSAMNMVSQAKSDAETAMNAYESAKSDTVAAKSEYDSAMFEVNKAAGDVTAAKSAYESAKIDAETAKSEYDQAMSDVDQARTDLGRAREELARAEAEGGDVQEAERAVAEAEEALQQAEDVAADIGQQADEAEAAADEASKAMKEAEEILSEAEAEAEEIKQKVTELEAAEEKAAEAVTETGKILKKAGEAAEETKQKAEDLETEAEKAESKIAGYETAVEEAEKNADQQKQTASRAKGKISSAREKYYDAEERYIRAEKEMLSRQSSSGRASDQYSTALNDYNTELNACRSLELEVSQLEAQARSDLANTDSQTAMLLMQFDNSKAAAISQIDKELKLQQEAMRSSEIRASEDGIITRLRIAKGNAVQAGSAVANVTNNGSFYENTVVSYVPISEARKLAQGMLVKVYPTTANRNEYGHMEGTIVSVDNYVTSREDMVNLLGDSLLVESFLRNGPVVEVTTQLKADDSTASGYYWSNRKGRELTIEEGTLVTTDMVTESKAPISMFIPYLKDKFDGISTRGNVQNGSGQNGQY